MHSRLTASRLAAPYLLVVLALFPVASAHSGDDLIEIVVVGDTGFNGAGARVSATGGYKHGQLLDVAGAVSGIRHELEADISLANLETVVTDNNSLGGTSKRFLFRTHPNAVRAFLDAGLNAFSLANNHALDFRQAGAGETLRHLNDMRRDGLLAFPGLGVSRAEAAAPHILEIGGTPVALSSIGIGGWGAAASSGKAGMLKYPADLDHVATRLAAALVELRILSVHYGREFEPETPQATRARFRQVISEEGITLVAGHHKHVANGVETVETASGGTGLIFYGLGNFLHLGMQNMGRHDLCHDFGLLGRVTLRRGNDGSLSVMAVRVVPLTDMHIATKPMAPDEATTRVHVINHLSRQLTDRKAGAYGLHFVPQADGSGLWCNPEETSGTCISRPQSAPVSRTLSNKIARECRRVLTR